MSSSFFSIVFLACLGLFISIIMERFVKPRPNLHRPWAAWSIHLGLFFTHYGLMVLILARPHFGLVLSLATVFTLVLINNTKLQSLRESLTAQDYEFITDIILHPRFFLPYFGMKNFLFAVSGFIVALLGFFYETVPPERLSWAEQGAAIFLLLFSGGVCLIYAYLHTYPARFKALQTRFRPLEDMQNLGMFATLWVHAFAMRQKPDVTTSPFIIQKHKGKNKTLPHLIAIQSESFFDPRTLFPTIQPNILKAYDIFQKESVQHGALQVPAFGGNTVRTEFSFLTGLNQDALGAHRFNPYVVAATGYAIPSLPLFLKSLGYHIIFIHPFEASFYKRNKVFQHWGVDNFLDISHFTNKHHYGPYVSDVAVAKCILDLMHKAHKPTCIFAITMENHGPLHLESVRPKDITNLYTTLPPEDFDDLTIYLRHIHQADTMLTLLYADLKEFSSPVSLCWYGDHMPILPNVYRVTPPVDAHTNYFLWNNRQLQKSQQRKHVQHERIISKISSHELATIWLKKTHSNLI